MSIGSPLRHRTPTQLLLNVSNSGYSNASQLFTIPSEIAAATNLTVGTQKVGTVAAGSIASQTVGIYRCLPQDKLARLRVLNVDNGSSGSGTTFQLGLGLFPSFSTTSGAAATDGPINAAIPAVGNSCGLLARATLTVDATAFPGGTRSTNPFNGAALPGALTGKSLRGCSGISWGMRHSTQQYADDGFATGSIGTILVDLSFSDYLIICLETIADVAKTGALVIGLETECS